MVSHQQLLSALLQDPAGEGTKGKTKINGSSLPLYKAPKLRLAEALEKAVDKTFDAVLCSDLDQSSLAILGWCFHRIKPSLSPTDLRVAYWEDLYDAMRIASERYKAIY